VGSRFVRIALALVCVLTAATVALVWAIDHETGADSHAFLLWNLFLAWIPLLFALALEVGRRHSLGAFALTALGAGWLLFLPNAPYIATDIVHLGDEHYLGPFWLDLTTLFVAAACGGLVGFLSLVLVQRTVRERVGPAVAWAFVVATITVTSFGIYLGRIVRLNSWDVVTRPRVLGDEVLERLADPLAYPRMLAGTAARSIALLVVYAVFYRVASALDRTSR
jgi:uncharacterized membrane protein